MRASWLLFLIAILSAWMLSTCTTPENKDAEGKRLATTYCGTCHQLPSPAELDKNTWLLGVLPEMGARLGIRSYAGLSYKPNNDEPAFYPPTPAMTAEEWDKLVTYFYNEAPDSLSQKYEFIHDSLGLFRARLPAKPVGPPPTTTYVRIDPGNHGIYEAQGLELTLRSYNTALARIGEIKTPQVVVDVAFGDLTKPGLRNGMMLTMGELRPTDVTHGSIQAISVGKDLKLSTVSPMLLDGLPRPVNIQPADINGDGLLDFVVCGYGNFTGELFWLKNTGDDHFEKIVIKNQAGSIQSIVRDFNGDGRPDVLALMAQGDESIRMFEQLPGGNFSEKILLKFSPVAGSISIDLADFNQDGFPDIVYTSGDNADYSKILKPYHGVYIFMNDGHWNFTQRYFFRINGCFDAVARDFDLDGDLDIAAISFFADYPRRPQEGFVYLRNNGALNFTPYTIPEHSVGRWITLDAADFDGDGDQDIVLANLSIGPSNLEPDKKWRSGPPFILLENTTR